MTTTAPAKDTLQLDQLWRRCKQRKDDKARDQIINHYARLVKITAGRIVPNLPANMDRDDLVGAGAMGLIKAVDQYDPDRGIKFETYAIALIRGAILEMLRGQDWVPRSVRDGIKDLDRAHSRLEIRLGRPPTEDEVAQELEISADDLRKLAFSGSHANVASLDDILLGGGSGDGENLSLGDALPDKEANVASEAEKSAMLEALAAGIDRLPERERLVTALYYYEGLTFKEVAQVLSVSESRAYQIHGQAVNRMRNYLGRDAVLFTDRHDEAKESGTVTIRTAPAPARQHQTR